jgi:basic membrane protein A
MKHHKILLGLGLSLVLAACGDKGSKAGQPAVVFDAGGKHDKSFNESAFNGAELYKKESGKDYTSIEMTAGTDLEGVLRKLAQRGGEPIVAVGDSSTVALTKIAAEFPNVHFAIIDAAVNAPNVKSIKFREEEGSFLVGALAAMKSTTGKIAFIGGMDIPVIGRFSCGYEQGAKYVNPNITMIKKIVSSNGNDAWNNPSRGGELAKGAFDEGADIIFAAAGATGKGVYQAASDAKKLAIGVDQNQNGLFKGTMLTSMVKSVDVAVHGAFKEGAAGQFKAGEVSLGLAQNGLDWALDENNRSLVTPEMEAKVNQIKKDIVDGKIKMTCAK